MSSAKATVDFLGDDKKLQSTIDGIGGSVKKLEGTFTAAFKAGAAIFTTEKIISFGKAALQAAGQTEQFKTRFEEINDSVTRLQAAIGSVLIPALESIVPILDKIAAAFDGVDESGTHWTMRLEKNIAVLIADFQDAFNRSHFSGLDILATYQSTLPLNDPGARVIQAQQNAAADAARRQQQQNEVGIGARNARNRIINAPGFGGVNMPLFLGDMGSRLQDRFALLGGNEGREGRLAAIEKTFDIATKFGEFFGGGGAAGGQALGGMAGKELGGGIAEALKESGVFEGGGGGFQSGIEDLSSLFNRIQSSAASTQEQEIKKVATNTEKTSTFAEKTAKATEGLLEKFKDGIAATFS